MKYIRTLILVLFVSFTLSAMPAFVHAATVNVSQNCSASDAGGNSHTYSGQFLGICALVAAHAQGAVSSYTLAYDDSFGFYLLTMNGVTPGDTEYWALYQNGAYANDGLSSMVVANGDTLSFQLTDWSTNTDVGSPISFTISLQSSGGGSGGESGGGQIEVPFNVTAALAFLSGKQKMNGSFGLPAQAGTDFLTDWAAIALASAGPSKARDIAHEYLLSASPSMTTVTDYERHAMALMALGIDPYIGTATDYITPIVKAYDGTQIGDTKLVNDDIFALFPLPKAGYAADSEIIQHTIAFILAKQNANGAWEGSADLTAAAIQALAPFDSVPGVTTALTKAKEYLREVRGLDGNWKNSFEASWVVQALHALNEPISSWIQDGRTPMSTLANMQERDGGIEPVSSSEGTRIWATAYAIPAALGKPWNDILHSFSKPVITSVILEVSTTTATSTNATTTLALEKTASTTISVPTIEAKVAPITASAPVLAIEKINESLPQKEGALPTLDTSLNVESQVAAAANATTPWFDSSWLILIFGMFGITGILVFLMHTVNRGN